MVWLEVVKPVLPDYDQMALKVFMEAISSAGGLKKLIEYRNLTWLPSLAEAAYVVVLKNEATLTDYQIAEKLGITEQTVKNILKADTSKVAEYLQGVAEKVDEHKAGGLAKIAYEKLKAEGRLESEEVTQAEARDIESSLEIEFFWAIQTLRRIKGLDFPAGEGELKERLTGITIKGRRIEELLDKIGYPVKTPAELLHKLKEAAER
ncbi:MAG: KaiC associated regulatory domain-containing protein [Candidatus Freyarchaeota archaeon]